MIEVKNLTKKFGEVVAISNVSFSIKSGEVVGLLGPNGAGKSTTIKTLAGTLMPDSGEVIFNSQNILLDPKAPKRKIGYMPENNPLYLEMLVSEALNYVLDLYGIKQHEERKKRMDYAVLSTGLQKVFNKQIATLSKGFRQRVGLAQVLLVKPDLLILDEPTEGLDPNQRQEIRNLIKEIGKDNTVILSTHVMQEVEAVCSRIILLNKGNVVLDGTKSEIEASRSDSTKIKIKLKGDNSVFDNIKNNNLVFDELEKTSTPNGLLELRVRTKHPEDFYKEFSRLVAEYKWVLYELIPEQYNLEDLFKELTN